MATTTLAPDAILAQSGWSTTPVVTDIDEDPDSPGSDWINAYGFSYDPEVRVSFPTPPGTPKGTQTFKAYARPRKSSVLYSLAPHVQIDLYENGTLLASGASQALSLEGMISQSFNFDSLTLEDPSGAGIEARFAVAHSTRVVFSGGEGGGPPNGTYTASADLNALNWDTVNYLAPVDSAPLVLKWDLTGQVSKSLDLVYDVASIVESDELVLKWDLAPGGTPVDSAALVLKWDLVGQVDSAPLRLKWDTDRYGRPVVSRTADDLYESMGCFTVGDEDRRYSLLLFCDALCSAMLERIHELAAEIDGRPGWQVVFDPDAVYEYAIAYLGQFVGTALEAGWTLDEKRTAVRIPEGWRRGSRAAMIASVQRNLSGSKSVNLIERMDADAYKLGVHVLAAEQTAVPSEMVRSIKKQKPIGLNLVYSAEGGETWTEFDAATTSWNDAATKFPTWYDVAFAAP